MVPSRLIDAEEGVRTRPLKVICAGMSRTGTFSMYMALQQLGFHPWHVAEAVGDPKRSFSLATEALNASFYPREGETAYSTADFDRWIGGYDAVLDIPMNLLTPTLLTAYPTAKVILTTRTPASWRRSIERTVLQIANSPSFNALSYFSAECAAYMAFVHLCGRIMNGWSEDALVAHEDRVRAVVPSEQFLESRIGRDGWRELCGFLGVEGPEGQEDFVKLNTSDSGLFQAFTGEFGKGMAVRALKKAVLGAAPVVLLSGAILWRRWS